MIELDGNIVTIFSRDASPEGNLIGPEFS